MKPYSVFARYYDALMTDVDYKAQAAYLGRLFARFGLAPRLLLDLGCGTGSLMRELLALGYEAVGVDESEEMLSAAAEKLGGDPRAVLVCQPMQAIDLYGTVDAAVCLLDGINHLTDPRQVREAFRRVSLFLNPGGLFVFDLNSPRQFETVLADNAFVYDCGDVYCVWQNSFTKKTGLCRFGLTFFERDGALYRRSGESFSERSYRLPRVEKWLREAGLEPLAVFDGFGFGQAREDSARLLLVARKPESGEPASLAGEKPPAAITKI